MSQQPPLLRMPLHLLSMVLSHLGNMQSLASAIFSHSSLYLAFKEDGNRIVRDIMTSQIPDDTMKYALCTHAATLDDLDRNDEDQILQFLSDNFLTDLQTPKEPFALPGPVDLHLASALSRTHSIIQYFTSDLLRDTLPLVQQHLGLRRPSYTVASAEEELRIHRAMYRFQLYCNLFRQRFSGPRKRHFAFALHDRFFRTFSPWVNQQLACINDYFERVLCRAFGEMAAHDVQWGAELIDWLTLGKANGHRQGYLFYGLDFLYQLDQAKPYDQRRDVLRLKGDLPPFTWHTLAAEFSRGSIFAVNERSRVWRQVTRLVHAGKYASISCWWPHNGPDVYGSAPFRMWSAAYAASLPEDAAYELKHSWLRRCGYVLWDHPDTPLSDEALRETISEASRLSLLNHFRRNDGKAKAKKSRRERREIYARGGRGYWSEGNLSQIVWTKGSQGTPTDASTTQPVRPS